MYVPTGSAFEPRSQRIPNGKGRTQSPGALAPRDKKGCVPSWMTVGLRLWPIRGPTVNCPRYVVFNEIECFSSKPRNPEDTRMNLIYSTIYFLRIYSQKRSDSRDLLYSNEKDVKHIDSDPWMNSLRQLSRLPRRGVQEKIRPAVEAV